MGEDDIGSRKNWRAHCHNPGQEFVDWRAAEPLGEKGGIESAAAVWEKGHCREALE